MKGTKTSHRKGEKNSLDKRVKIIRLRSQGKINYSIDVGAVHESGYHSVDMVMTQIKLFDMVELQCSFEKKENKGEFPNITMECNRPYIPLDERNIAYKAAALIIEKYGRKSELKSLHIVLKKIIPVGAGLAGGSGNGAAVLHGLNMALNLNLTLEELCSLGAEIGSDVPFSIVSQAKVNKGIPLKLRQDPKATTTARATGRGTELEPIKGMSKIVLMVKPNFSVSTREVYQGIDECQIIERPDNDKLVDDLKRYSMIHSISEQNKIFEQISKNMINVLEIYTLKKYSEIEKIKKTLGELPGAKKVLMSGSGPTVYALFNHKDIQKAKEARNLMKAKGYLSLLTNTLE